MAYSQPPASALDFVLWRANYVQPPASATNFELTTAAGVYYPPIPGVIKDVATPWRPDPAVTDRELETAHQVARVVDITRSANSSQASSLVQPDLDSPFQNADAFSQNKAVAWDPVAAKERQLTAVHEQGKPRDVEARRSTWENASLWIDLDRAAPFLVKTPWKDRTQLSKFFSVDLYGNTWRRQENTPAPIAKAQVGLAELGFLQIRQLEDSGLFVLAPAWEQVASQPRDRVWIFSASQGVERDVFKDMPWGPSGRRDTTLVFTYPDYPGPIEFPDTFTIPTLRFYIVANSAQIVRVSDGRDVPASAVSLSINSDQYTWAMNATLASTAARALVEGQEGEPVEVDVTINGITWRVLVDGWNDSQAWNKDSISISGRSLTAYLAPPYAAPRDYVEGSGLLAQQLATQELPPGWTLDWNMVDWFVPAGAWQYQNLTPIEAISRIAQAGAGYVQADPALQKILVNPLWPEAPWNLDTLGPDFQVPVDLVTLRSTRKVPGQSVNGVYVFGGSVNPYHANVIRRNSNGTPLGRQVVNPLVTDRTPAEALGIAAIAATGRQALETHELPLSDSLGGLIPVGSLLEVGKNIDQNFLVDWRGLVRGVNVTAKASRAGNRGVKLVVRQALQIQRPFDED